MRRASAGRGGGPASFAALVILALATLTPTASAGQRAGHSTVVDGLGRRVVVPGPVERIVSLEPEITRIIVALGAADRLVGIDYFLRHHDHLFPLVFPDGLRLPLVSNPGQELNYETAIGLRPDLVFASPSEAGTAEAIEKKLGVPVLALASMGRVKDLLAEIETVGRLLGRDERAAALTASFRSRLEAVRRPGPAGGAGDRPSVYLAFWGSLARTPVSYDPVDLAGGRNVAAGLLPSYLGSAGVTVPIEEILIWDPDVILIQGNYLPQERRVTVAGVLGDPRLASLRAVKSGRVYYTFGFWYWWDPALVLVETLYLSRLLHPGAGPAMDLRGEGDAIFEEFYGVPGVFGRLYDILKCHEWTTK
jgi:iron complex transport system substrate-binding protein